MESVVDEFLVSIRIKPRERDECWLSVVYDPYKKREKFALVGVG